MTSAKFYTNISTNMDTTKIFQFLGTEFLLFFPQNIKWTYFIIAYILSKALNYNYDHALKLTIDVIFRWL